jgi:hypothetical protein
LVEGYCDFLENKLAAANKNLNQAIKLTESPAVSQAQKDSAKASYESMKDKFEDVQMKALDLARQLPTPRVEQKRAALKPEFEKANREIERFAEFNQRVIQSDRFEESRKRVLDDSKLTGAVVTSRMAQQGVKPDGPGLEELGDLDDLEE